MATTIFSPYRANDTGLNYPRDASFSSYLDTTERDFVKSLAESINSPSSIREISTPRRSMGRNISRVQRSGGSDVFGAERYFNEKIDDKKGSSNLVSSKDGVSGNNKHRCRREKRDDLFERKSSTSKISTSSSFKSPTPSLKSEGSFNNSQIGFLLQKKGSVGHKIFSGFQCKGSCFNKKSVYTTNTHQTIQSSPKSYQGNNNVNNNGYRKSRLPHHQEHFAFPIIDTASFHLDHPRKSMEVFGLHSLGKQEIISHNNLEKKLSILAWDAIPNTPSSPFTISLKKKSSTTSSPTIIVRTDQDEDVCSVASSDLFEIENLSGAPCSQASTPYYAPSEASIEWSVVTASAADNFSAFSDYDDEKIAIPRQRSKNITMENKKVQRSSNSGGMFLGCTSHKAVDVVQNYNLP
ncbi:hypothetical protein BVRB_5g126680 [Beta vulgaris subsp. vulgaris]|uniref:Uncharacterized protein n=1 Tax=Beta vulgaris subsp. vulgaris TaxID=3555 RepID=A0A0J8BBR9_BETVV|nr:protein PHYTOCHROME KINASE SUBSTRATE 3 [Beta vulgaris subsp. vulgaris]KMS97468.1 hypothetical protein BVRB_5g126680 [Beta vulgaris subsp. vulgaris]